MKAVVDTNVLFSYFYIKDKFHSESRKIILKLDEIIIPSIVLIELVYLFKKYGLDVNIISEFLELEEVKFTENKLKDFLFALSKNPKSYDEFNDYVILHTALRLNVNLETFDKELKDLFLIYSNKKL